MSGWLLDTTVLSELRKPRCSLAVRNWTDAQSNETLFVSEVAFAEIRFGIEQAADHALRERLSRWLEETLRPWFAGRVLPVNEDVLVRWRLMVETGRKNGHTFSQPDLFIAATASIHDLTVVSRNVDDFKTSGVGIFNPWKFVS